MSNMTRAGCATLVFAFRNLSLSLPFASATDTITAAAAVAGVIVATSGLIYAGKQLAAAAIATEGAQKASEGQFLLELEDQLHRHVEVHTALIPGGRWTVPGAGPESVAEWAQVASYLGLFERMNALRRNGSLSLSDIKPFYSYRLVNLWTSEPIRKKIEKSAWGWKHLIELSAELEIPAAVALQKTKQQAPETIDAKDGFAAMPLPEATGPGTRES